MLIKTFLKLLLKSTFKKGQVNWPKHIYNKKISLKITQDFTKKQLKSADHLEIPKGSQTVIRFKFFKHRRIKNDELFQKQVTIQTAATKSGLLLISIQFHIISLPAGTFSEHW